MSKYKSQQLKRKGENLYRNGEGVYYARLFRGGKQYKKSLKTHDRKTAERKVVDFEREVERNIKLLPDITFDDLSQKWQDSLYHLKASSRKRRKVQVSALLPFFTKKKLRDIKKIDVQAWAAKRAPLVEARTFNADRNVLHQMFEYAKEKLSVIESNPVEGLETRRELNVKVTPPTQEEFRQLLAYVKTSRTVIKHVRQNPYYFIQFLGYTGMRVNEARNVLWQDVDFGEAGSIKVTGGEFGTKNHRERYLPLFPAARTLLEEMKAKLGSIDPTQPIFDVYNCNWVLASASKHIGKQSSQYFTHHDMRHFFCSNALEQNIPDHAIADWLGHSDGGILVKKTYGHLRKSFGDAEALKMTFKA